MEVILKKKTKPEQSTRQIIGINEITEYSLKTASSEAVFFSVKPSNISVMSEESLAARIYSLTTVLKGIAEIEILCTDSRESFEGNKSHMRNLAKAERNPAVRILLEQDMQHIDHIQAQTATARDFLLVVRIRNLKEKEALSYLNRIEKTLSENGFTVRRYGRQDIKTLLAVYYEQNVTTEKFDDIDGERWCKETLIISDLARSNEATRAPKSDTLCYNQRIF